jgi:hypothetical protein
MRLPSNDMASGFIGSAMRGFFITLSLTLPRFSRFSRFS